jgi:hypothetical protein
MSVGSEYHGEPQRFNSGARFRRMNRKGDDEADSASSRLGRR